MPATTRLSLISRIGSPGDTQAWTEFVQLYGPLVYSIARRRGLQDADACDLVQDVMREVSRSVTRFEPDPELGRFRGWLGVIVRRMLSRFFERSRRQVVGTGGTTNHLVISVALGEEEEDAWDQEHRQHMFRWAAGRVHCEFTETTWRAFWLTAVDGVSAKRAAEECGLSVGAIYIAKSRVLNRLRQMLDQVDDPLLA
ncbi:MAG: sigma-70 family RNA polymerase sigma factor [Planctomycetota bacterium]